MKKIELSKTYWGFAVHCVVTVIIKETIRFHQEEVDLFNTLHPLKFI